MEKQSQRSSNKSEQFTASMRTRAEASAAKIFTELKFPKNKEEILSFAKENEKKAEYPQPLITVLDRIPDRSYDSMQDVEREIGKVQQ
jgi:hypothetical protein